MAQEYAYFPGCSNSATARAYEASARAVARALDIRLRDLRDWNCCGATSYSATRPITGHVLNARNLALSEALDPRLPLVTTCTGCYLNMVKANKVIEQDAEARAAIDRSLAAGGLSYSGGTRVRHLLQVLTTELALDAVARRVTSPLRGLKVAPYYGCQLVRPYSDGDNPDDPISLDRLLTTLGAEVVPYPPKTRCCGGMLMVSHDAVAIDLIDELIGWAEACGAATITTICPLCYVNLEGYQGRLKRSAKQRRMPISFFTQIVGLAFGIAPAELGIGAELVSLEPVVALAGGAK